MLMNASVSRRLRFERWKNRQGALWDFITTPLLLLILALLTILKLMKLLRKALS
jgi:hypothetical protein